MTQSVILIFIISTLLQCSISWAIKPLPKAAESEDIPAEILEAIETEKEMKREVIERKMEELKEEIKKTDIKKLRVKPSQPKVLKERPPTTVIITALIILLVAFYIYRRR